MNLSTQDFHYAETDTTHMVHIITKPGTRFNITTSLDRWLIGKTSSSANKWRTLLIFEENNASAAKETEGALEYPNQGQDGKRKSGPMNKRRMLVCENRKE